MWCIAKTIAAALQAWPSVLQTSAICDSPAPSPPNWPGI